MKCVVVQRTNGCLTSDVRQPLKIKRSNSTIDILYSKERHPREIAKNLPSITSITTLKVSHKVGILALERRTSHPDWHYVFKVLLHKNLNTNKAIIFSVYW